MNFNFYLLGTPSDGYDQYPLDNNSFVFKKILQTCKSESELTVIRNGQLVHYVFVRKVPGKSGLCLGFALTFNGIYCKNCHALNDLFNEAYLDVLMQGVFLRFQKDKYSYIVARFADEPNEIKRISRFFANKLDKESKCEFSNISSSFKVGRGYKELSIKESKDNINCAFAEYDELRILDKEKSVSELERTQQMLSNLYAEHGELREKYHKVLNQKRNLKLVIFLVLIIIGCLSAILFFDNVLNDKNTQISQLKSDVYSKEIEIERHERVSDSLNKTIRQYKYDISSLNQNISELNSKIFNLSEEKDELLREKSNLTREINAQRERERVETYEVYVLGGNKAYCYYKCGSNYFRTDCYYSDFQRISVYFKTEEYALTQGGYVKLEDLRRIKK